MLPIYDKFLAVDEVIEHKTCFGHLKSYNNSMGIIPIDLQVDFTEDPSKPCLIFFYAGNQRKDFAQDSLIADVVTAYHSNKHNILVLDTIIEDFINAPFLGCLDKLIQKGIDLNRVKLVTSANPNWLFKRMFLRGDFVIKHMKPENAELLDDLEVISYDGFSTSFITHMASVNIELPEIGPREITKRFSLLQKNSRYCRKIVHAFFVHNKLHEDNVYSWHNEGMDNNWGEWEEKALEFFDIPVDFETYRTPVYFDDVMSTDEWCIEDEIQHCAFNTYVETSAPRDEPFAFWGETRHHTGGNFGEDKMYFLTEKSYKSFWYGLPYIHISYPLEDIFHKLGYKTFKNLFDYERVEEVNHYHYLENDFRLLKVIKDTSIDELNSMLNTPEIYSDLRHNRKMLLRLLPLQKLRADLDKY